MTTPNDPGRYGGSCARSWGTEVQPGPPRGESVETTLEVTKSRVEQPAGTTDKPVLGTAGLLAAVTDLTREIIEPHLGPREVAVTSTFEVKHRAPIPMGAEAELIVTVAQVGPMRMLCDFVVRHNGTVAARGSHAQTVVELDDWQRRLDESS